MNEITTCGYLAWSDSYTVICGGLIDGGKVLNISGYEVCDVGNPLPLVAEALKAAARLQQNMDTLEFVTIIYYFKA